MVTDNASLLWMVNLKDPNSRVSRPTLNLQSYDYELLHRKGKFMVVADALSIKSQPDDQWCEYAELHHTSSRQISRLPNQKRNSI